MGLSKEQVDHWRKALIYMIGPYALLLPDKDVEGVANRLIEKINKDLAQENPPAPTAPRKTPMEIAREVKEANR